MKRNPGGFIFLMIAWFWAVTASSNAKDYQLERIAKQQCEYYYDRRNVVGVSRYYKYCGCIYYFIYEGDSLYKIFGVKLCKRHGNFIKNHRGRRQ